MALESVWAFSRLRTARTESEDSRLEVNYHKPPANLTVKSVEEEEVKEAIGKLMHKVHLDLVEVSGFNFDYIHPS